MPEGWKFREMGRPGSERRDKEFLSREGFVFRFYFVFCHCLVLFVVIVCHCLLLVLLLFVIVCCSLMAVKKKDKEFLSRQGFVFKFS